MIRQFTLLAFGASFSFTLTAQVSTGGIPYGLRTGMDLREVPTVRSAPFDAAATAVDDARRANAHLIPAYARLLPVVAGLRSAGLWTDLPNGDRVWRLRVLSDGALATELYFRDFFLPDNAALYVYSADGRNVLGGYTAYNNTASGTFATSLISGEASIMEYYEPYAVRGEGRLVLASVGHAYRDVERVRGLSDPCEVDVNCSEGADWTAQRDAVVRVGVVQGAIAGWCSGALVNNLAEDCKPYFLTADHCSRDDAGNQASAADFNLWRFYFNYERDGCDGGGGSAGNSILGCTRRGDSNDNGGSSGSDFLLVEANNDEIPSTYHPYWSGWDASGTGSTGGVCIHHPAGDRKKISTYNGNTTSSSWSSVPGTHWRVNWAATAHGHGVTEGGSSGSPLFNSGHRIIGTLTGGGSGCDHANFPDYFGKVSYHWQSDPGPANDKLKHWLDPESTGVLSMDGSYDPCDSGIGIAEVDGADRNLDIFPVPASDVARVELPEGLGKDVRLLVHDMSGRTVASIPAKGGKHIAVDVSRWDAGMYTVSLVESGMAVRVAPLIVARP